MVVGAADELSRSHGPVAYACDNVVPVSAHEGVFAKTLSTAIVVRLPVKKIKTYCMSYRQDQNQNHSLPPIPSLDRNYRPRSGALRSPHARVSTVSRLILNTRLMILLKTRNKGW